MGGFSGWERCVEPGVAGDGRTQGPPGMVTLIGGHDIVVPDLCGVPGFDPAWALQPAQSLRWSASRIGRTLGLGIDPQPFDGAMQRRGFGTDTFTP